MVKYWSGAGYIDTPTQGQYKTKGSEVIKKSKKEQSYEIATRANISSTLPLT